MTLLLSYTFNNVLMAAQAKFYILNRYQLTRWNQISTQLHVKAEMSFGSSKAAEKFKGVDWKDWKLLLLSFYSPCHITQWKSNPAEPRGGKHVVQSKHDTTWLKWEFGSHAGALLWRSGPANTRPPVIPVYESLLWTNGWFIYCSYAASAYPAVITSLSGGRRLLPVIKK